MGMDVSEACEVLSHRGRSHALDVPVAVFLFKRSSTLPRIFRVLSEVRPKKVYLIGDGARDSAEEADVRETRRLAESLITWECDVVTDYAEENRGVFQNIGLGAIRVLEKEPSAIFLEDDNLPEPSFFSYCQAMLEEYWDEERVAWICGTNYLGEYTHPLGYSYLFTQHLLPCGWASWGHKFADLYDGELTTYTDENKSRFSRTYTDKRLARQQLHSVGVTKKFLGRDVRRASWDYQMLFSVRTRDRYGIVPRVNQVRNIGVDELSTHGGTSFANEMTKRLCGMDSHPLEGPYKGPAAVEVDPALEALLGSILLYPWQTRLLRGGATWAKKTLRIDDDESLATLLKDARRTLLGRWSRAGGGADRAKRDAA